MAKENKTGQEGNEQKAQSSSFSQFYQQNKRLVYIAAVILVALIAVLSVGTCGGGSFKKSLGVDEAFDSVVAILPKKSQIVARYPDETRHSLYYLNSGVMYCFDGKSKLLEQVTINNVPDAVIEKAELSADEQYITLWVTAGEQKMLFRLNSMNGNIVDISDQRPAEKDNMKPDEPLPAIPVVTKKEEPATTVEQGNTNDIPSIDATKPAPETETPAPTPTQTPAPANTGSSESAE